MKRIAALLVTMIMIFTLAACAQEELPSYSSDDGQNAADSLSVGSTMPDSYIELLDGTSVTLSEMDKPYMLNFWATWCGPCVSEMPHMQKIYEEMNGKFEIIAVNLSEDKTTVESFINLNGYSFKIGMEENYELSNAYGAYSIPLSFMVDKDGKITAVQVGAMSEAKMREFIGSALGE